MIGDAAHEARPRVLRGWALDVAGAALTVLFLVLATSHLQASGDDRAIDWLGDAVLVVAGASMALCRHRPQLAVYVVTAALATYVGRNYVGGPVFVTAWIALFFSGWRTDRRTALTGAAVLCGVLTVVGELAHGGFSLLPLVFVGWSAAAVFLGDAMRNRRNYLTELEERAHYLAHTRDEEARRRVAEERLRIARDLHDSVAHGMATINVQAGAAAHVMDRRPAAAKEALEAIQRASGDVLDELAAMLTLLRQDGEEVPDRTPTPGIEQIAELVAASSGARLPVSLTVDGPTHLVASSVGTAAYRTVQESLTNAIRHSGATAVTVRVRVGADRGLTVEVSDDGIGADDTSTGTGMGLRGMRERAEATGGHLEAGSRPDGGFTVRATWAGP